MGMNVFASQSTWGMAFPIDEVSSDIANDGLILCITKTDCCLLCSERIHPFTEMSLYGILWLKILLSILISNL